MKLRITIDGTEHEIDATRQGDALSVMLNGVTQQLSIVSQDGSSMLVELGHKRLQIAGMKDGLKRQLAVNGRQLRYERVSDDPAAADSAEGSLSSSIPAVVSELLVAEGDSVQAGDKLILLESMKMIIPIQATLDGTVTALHCATGDSVQAGVPLIEITPS